MVASSFNLGIYFPCNVLTSTPPLRIRPGNKASSLATIAIRAKKDDTYPSACRLDSF